MSKVQPTKAHTITDYELGKLMYRRCVSFDACVNERMQAGWNAAENNAAWGVFDDSPEDAVRFEYARPHFSEAAFKEVAYNNEYSFNGVDYNEPSVQ